ncbi:hypothetical protein CAEBREN_12956 [Caenorhabditis brenneri]|uniref:F-box domain-containing protein n=1 Tax=Caenorhabditis brenneri TaxID=135651 RepID=G0MUJ0_CAEBE|nr:hypothetical protein CAEBREN_12956 [Caenorhabditis brenneri]
MNLFNLLQLPSVPLEIVVKKLHSAKVIELSMMSSKFKQRLQEFKLKTRSLTWEYPHYIRVSSPNLELNFGLNGPWNTRKINGKQVMMKSNYSMKFCSFLFIECEDRNYLQLLEDMTVHLLSILRIQRFNFASQIKSYVCSLNEIFVWKYCQKFYTIRLESRREITPNEVTFLLDNIETKELEICCKIENFQYEKPINSDVLKVFTFEWMNPKCFLSDRYTQLMFFGAMSTYFHYFRAVLNNWLAGGNNNLRNCFLGENLHEITALDFSRDLPGVETRPSVFSYEDLRSRTAQLIDENDGKVDVRRECDGRLATIIWTQHRIELLVWNNDAQEKLKNFSKF